MPISNQSEYVLNLSRNVALSEDYLAMMRANKVRGDLAQLESTKKLQRQFLEASVFKAITNIALSLSHCEMTRYLDKRRIMESYHFANLFEVIKSYRMVQSLYGDQPTPKQTDTVVEENPDYTQPSQPLSEAEELEALAFSAYAVWCSIKGLRLREDEFDGFAARWLARRS